ncbi:MAG: [FeFe] hydrogenase, group A [Patescibacteria group bacterium]|nr:[FeFe] hydrogenase, group A [Patescibacteria group bacterium]MDD4611096.1 [FeFe] hydrogenase, group A [Patescibacteria group bacterium]
MKKVKIKINNKVIKCEEGRTILNVARQNDIFIPALCSHPDFPPKANCRVCCVEINGRAKLAMSCKTKVKSGMEIRTDTDRVKKARNLNIELIFAEHIEKCPTCIWRVNCELLNLADRYKLEICRFPDRKGKRKIYKFSNAVEIDGTQCIDCRNCLDACSLMQKINYLELKGKGSEQEIIPLKSNKILEPPLFRAKDLLSEKNKSIDCIYCGQCALHCPVGAAQEQAHWDKVEEILKKKKSENKVVVAQFAPSIRVSIGEEFGLPYGQIVTEQIVSALRALGFDYVFDTSFAADVTTMVEAEELLERLARIRKPLPGSATPLLIRRGDGGEVPMITSCCPAWVKYVEFYHPKLIPNLTTARSPHVHNGGLVKTYWAEKMGIKPKDIIVVSVMPCTAKKFEVSRPELKINGNAPVDYVITTREFAWLMKKNNIDFANIEKTTADNPLGEFSGSAVLYGGSGGVMESALRAAQALACEKSKAKICERRIDFKEVRGLEGVKEATVTVAGKKLRVAVVNGIGCVDEVLKNLNNYDYIEVMACPGGCIGGGGQPIPTTQEIRRKRIEALYKIDKDKKVRRAHENKGVIEALDWLKKNKDLEHKVLHTTYVKRT